MISRKSKSDETSQKRTKTDNTIVKNEQRQKDNEPQNTTQITKD